MDEQGLSKEDIVKQKHRLDTYRYFSNDPIVGITFQEKLLSASDVFSIPSNSAFRDMGGEGPNNSCLIRYDGGKIVVENQKTDVVEGISPVMFHGNIAIRIRSKRKTKDNKKTSTDVPFSSYKVDELVFPVYHSIMAILGEMIIYKKFPLEWSCCWIVYNLSNLRIIDGYTSVVNRKKPLRLKRIISTLIALENTGIAIYTKKEHPEYLQVETGIHIKLYSENGKRISPLVIPSTIDKTKKDLIPIPNYYIRKTSELDEEGLQKYEIYSSTSNCSLALSKIHGKMKIEEKIDKKLLTISEVIVKCKRFISNDSTIYNIPYVSLNEVEDADKLLFK